jgi:hypothetical protein
MHWLALAMLWLLFAAGSAQGAQHQNAHIYSYWNWSGSGFWNVDQNLRIDRKAPATYWAEMVNFSGGGSGYLGLQTNGTRFDGSNGDTAIFSIWNASGSRGPSCGRFAGEGTGLSCRIPYSPAEGNMYRLRIWRLEADSVGQWWGAWVKSQASGIERYIGSIRAPLGVTSIRDTMNFVEYFGSQVPCNRVPISRVLWTQPAANSGSGGSYQYGSSYRSAYFGPCTTGSAAPTNLGWTRGVTVTQGLAINPYPNELAFVAQQYSDYLRRSISGTEANARINQLRGGASGLDVIHEIYRSPEADAAIRAKARLYDAAFNRRPDNGIMSWVGKSSLGVADAFVKSNEGRQKLPTDPAQFVKTVFLYADERGPTANELKLYTTYVRNAGRGAGLLAISETDEHKLRTYGGAGADLAYIAMLGRAPESASVRNTWADRLNRSGAFAERDLINMILHSNEYARRVAQLWGG